MGFDFNKPFELVDSNYSIGNLEVHSNNPVINGYSLESP